MAGQARTPLNLGDTAQRQHRIWNRAAPTASPGFNLHNDVLDLSQVLAEANLTGSLTPSAMNFIGNYVQVGDSGGNATLSLTSAALIPGNGAAL